MFLAFKKSDFSISIDIIKLVLYIAMNCGFEARKSPVMVEMKNK